MVTFEHTSGGDLSSSEQQTPTQSPTIRYSFDQSQTLPMFNLQESTSPIKGTRVFDGVRLREERVKRGWTRQKVADRIGVSAQSIMQWENNKYPPFLFNQEQLAETFNISLEEFFTIGNGSPVAEPEKPTYITPQNLPFIGRDEDIEKILTKLQNKQFVAITGTIGVGKSELAIQVVMEATRRELFPSVKIIYLQDKNTEDALAEIDRVLLHLPPNSLVLLDNCEHLKDFMEAIKQRRIEHPQLYILATSSETMNPYIDYPIKPLETNDAVQLFLAAAEKIGKNSSTSEMDDQKVEELCNRLGGLPLALLLAAALLIYDEFNKVYTWAKENSLLDTEIFITEDKRHKTTLKVLFGKLYTSIGKDEQYGQQLQALFRRLAIFVDPCGIKSVGTVCSIDNDLPEQEEPLGNLLRSLATHYLITYEDGWIEIIHNILRTFALLELKDKPEEFSEVRRKFIDNYRSFVIDYMKQQFNNEELEIAEYLENLHEKFDNTLHAYRLIIESGMKDILGEFKCRIFHDRLSDYIFEKRTTDFSSAQGEINVIYKDWCKALEKVYEQEQDLITRNPLLVLWQNFWIKVMKIDMFNPIDCIRHMDY